MVDRHVVMVEPTASRGVDLHGERGNRSVERGNRTNPLSGLVGTFDPETEKMIAEIEGKESEEVEDLSNTSDVIKEGTIVHCDDNFGGHTPCAADCNAHMAHNEGKPETISIPTTHTWAQMLANKKGVGNTPLVFRPPTIVAGKTTVHLLTHEFTAEQEDCEELVVGNFVGKRLAFGYVKEVLSRTWKLKEKFDMKTYKDNTFVFKFQAAEDRAKVIEIGSMHIASRLFVIRPWRPFLEDDVDALNTVPIWVCLKGIPLIFWSPKGIETIASAIGTPLMLDKTTEDKMRMNYAKVCVEMNVNSPFPTQIPVVVDGARSYNIGVEYTWRPIRCSHCKVFGHSTNGCKKNVNKPTTKVYKQVHKEAPITQGQVEIEEGWELPKKHHLIRNRKNITDTDLTTNNAANTGEGTNIEEDTSASKNDDVSDLTTKRIGEHVGKCAGKTIGDEPQVGEHLKSATEGGNGEQHNACDTTNKELNINLQHDTAGKGSGIKNTNVTDHHPTHSKEPLKRGGDSNAGSETQQHTFRPNNTTTSKERHTKEVFFEDSPKKPGSQMEENVLLTSAPERDEEQLSNNPKVATSATNLQFKESQITEMVGERQEEDRTNSTSTPLDWLTTQAINAMHTSTPMNWRTPEAYSAMNSSIASLGKDAVFTHLTSLLDAEAEKVRQNTVDDGHEATTIQAPAEYAPRRSSRNKKTNPKFR